MSSTVTVSQDARDRLRSWYDDELMLGVQLVQGSLAGWLFGMFGQAAVTLNGSVHLTSLAGDLTTRDGIALLGHEYLHVEQQRQMGWWRYLLMYALSWRPIHIREGWRHPMEAPAYARQREILEKMVL